MRFSINSDPISVDDKDTGEIKFKVSGNRKEFLSIRFIDVPQTREEMWHVISTTPFSNMLGVFSYDFPYISLFDSENTTINEIMLIRADKLLQLQLFPDKQEYISGTDMGRLVTIVDIEDNSKQVSVVKLESKRSSIIMKSNRRYMVSIDGVWMPSFEFLFPTIGVQTFECEWGTFNRLSQGEYELMAIKNRPIAPPVEQFKIVQSEAERLKAAFNTVYTPFNMSLPEPTNSISMNSMEIVLKKMKLDKNQSVFLDIGSGKGAPLFMASCLQIKGCIGIELDKELAQESLKILYTSKQTRTLSNALKSPIYVESGNILDYDSLGTVTHVYCFNNGMSPSTIDHIFQLVAHTETVKQFAICQVSKTIPLPISLVPTDIYVHSIRSNKGEHYTMYIIPITLTRRNEIRYALPTIAATSDPKKNLDKAFAVINLPTTSEYLTTYIEPIKYLDELSNRASRTQIRQTIATNLKQMFTDIDHHSLLSTLSEPKPVVLPARKQIVPSSSKKRTARRTPESILQNIIAAGASERDVNASISIVSNDALSNEDKLNELSKILKFVKRTAPSEDSESLSDSKKPRFDDELTLV